jgi:voltage-gated potassium channel
MAHSCGVRERVLAAMSVVFLAAYSVIVLVPEQPRPLVDILLVLLFACWAGLIVDFCLRLLRTSRGSRSGFVHANRFGLAAAILPLLGAFVVLKILRRVPGFRGNGGNALRSRVATRAGVFAILFIYVIGLTELAIERHAPHATIVSLGDAVWWACVTIATVGYGDYAPVTTLGRILAVVLMGGGLVIIGTASALILSYLQERIVRLKPPPELDETQQPSESR